MVEINYIVLFGFLGFEAIGTMFNIVNHGKPKSDDKGYYDGVKSFFNFIIILTALYVIGVFG